MMTKFDDLKDINTLIESYQNEMIEFQRKLVSIPAIGPLNGGDGEKKKADLIMEFINKIGFDIIEEYNSPDTSVSCGYRPNIIAKIKGSSGKKNTFWIMTHMDVVPPGDHTLWETHPYTLTVIGDKLIGRGTEDNHQGLVASIFSMKAIIEARVRPENNIGIVIASDEETSSKHGVCYLLDNHNIFNKDDMILVPDSGRDDGSMIEIAEKSLLWLKFIIKGKQCHGSMPSLGINSLKAGSDLILKLDRLYTTFNLANQLFDPPISTFEPTKREENVQNINTIPGRDVFYLDARVLPDYDLALIKEEIWELSKEVEQKWAVSIEIEVVQEVTSAPPTSIDTDIVIILKRAIKHVYGIEAKPIGIGGGTVAAPFRKKGFNAVVWSKIEQTAHQPNEYCLIKNMIDDTKVMAAVCIGI